MVPLYQSVLSGLLIGLKGEIGGSLGVYPKLCNSSTTDPKTIIPKRMSIIVCDLFYTTGAYE